MKTTFLLSTARRVLGFQMRNVLLSFWLKPYTIPYNELGGVFYMDKRPRADDSELRKVGVFAVKHLCGSSILNAECGIRVHRYDAIIMSSPHRNGGSPLSKSMQRTIPHNVRPTRSNSPFCCSVLVAANS